MISAPRIRVLGCMAALAVLHVSPAHAANVDPGRTQLLAQLCRIWGTIAFEHPYLWSRDVDWDGALLKALPVFRSNASERDTLQALREMLAQLGDPVTRLEESAASEITGAGAPAG